MSKWDKLVNEITSLSKGLRFSELKKVLESYGYVGKKPKGGSSHWTFRKEGKPPVTIPEDEPIKIGYIKLVRNIIEDEEE